MKKIEQLIGAFEKKKKHKKKILKKRKASKKKLKKVTIKKKVSIKKMKGGDKKWLTRFRSRRAERYISPRTITRDVGNQKSSLVDKLRISLKRNAMTKKDKMFSFVYHNKYFLFVGEDHDVKNPETYFSYFNKFPKPFVMLVECPSGYTSVKTAKQYIANYDKRYTKTQLEESEIDRYIYEASLAFYSKYRNSSKSLNEVSRNHDGEIICVDDRAKVEMYAGISNELVSSGKYFLNKTDGGPKTIGSMREAGIVESALEYVIQDIMNVREREQIGDNWNILTELIGRAFDARRRLNNPSQVRNSDQSIGEFFLDYNVIMNYVILKPNTRDRDFVFGIFGNNHIDNMREILSCIGI